MEMSLFVDSGAPSLYNQYVRSKSGKTDKNGKTKKSSLMGAFLEDRKFDDFSWYETKEFHEYRRKYVMFIKKHLEYIDVYANFDVINNAELTWENQKYMESKGLNPIPVFHFGCDEKWLEMYINKGYDYIAIGGMIPNPPVVLKPALDRMWGTILTDKNRMPKVKVHGFAVTSPWLITRYPWYSCDSASWVKYGQYGIVCVPFGIESGQPDYTKTAHNIFFSSRSPKLKDKGKHYTTYSPVHQEAILNYIHSKGHVLGESAFFEVSPDRELGENERFVPVFDKDGVRHKTNEEGRRILEVIITRGVSNDYKMRDEMNIQYYIDMQNSIPEWPWAFRPPDYVEGFKIKGLNV